MILSMRSLVSIKQQSPKRPCDILVANVGARDCQNCQNCQMCQKMHKAQNVQKQHFQGLANKGVCQCVVPASSGLFRPRGLAQPCPALSSLLQLTPARPGPRSLAQLPRGPGRVPIIQGAFQRSYRAQEP